MQDWIETVGKLGSASVAAAVLVATLAQNGWSNRVSRRVAMVEDQKIRLTLLERRIEVLDRFELVAADWFIYGNVTPAMVDGMSAVITSADLVFPDQVGRLNGCRSKLLQVKLLSHRLSSLRDDDSEARAKAVDDICSADEALGTALTALRAHLVEDAKLTQVPPLPPTWGQRLGGIFTRN